MRLSRIPTRECTPLKVEFGNEINRDEKQNFRTPAILRIYIVKDLRAGCEENNRPGPGNMEADKEWRRKVDLKSVAKDPTFQVAVVEFMMSHPDLQTFVHQPALLHFGFSRFAGCSECPCSPGIVVQFHNYLGIKKSWNVWVTLKD